MREASWACVSTPESRWSWPASIPRREPTPSRGFSAAAGATETAARYLTCARRLAGDRADPGLELVAGQALMAVGRAAEAVEMFGSVSRQGSADVRTAAQAAWMAGRGSYLIGDHRRAEDELARAADLAAARAPAEHRTAILAARRLTNAEIAGRLSITVKTVETHLSRIYSKLGVSRRDLILRPPSALEA
ncbi:response regulator transcription factor [Streptosporangium sp. G11]|uniref:response regulator transcription factor n=1 Tax=Streptosporangium sp. G11 TaxID=3436926 RepID=UPI003EBC36AF